MNNIIVAFKDSKENELGLLVFKKIEDSFFDFFIANKDIQEIKQDRLIGCLQDSGEMVSEFVMKLFMGCSHIVKSINQLYSCLLFIEVCVLETPMGATLSQIIVSSKEITETSNLPLCISLSGTSTKLEYFNFIINKGYYEHP